MPFFKRSWCFLHLLNWMQMALRQLPSKTLQCEFSQITSWLNTSLQIAPSFQKLKILGLHSCLDLRVGSEFLGFALIPRVHSLLQQAVKQHLLKSAIHSFLNNPGRVYSDPSPLLHRRMRAFPGNAWCGLCGPVCTSASCSSCVTHSPCRCVCSLDPGPSLSFLTPDCHLPVKLLGRRLAVQILSLR